MKIQNYDVQDDENDDFIQLHNFMPDRCFRMLICAPSGGGKTNLLLDMIYRLLYFDKKTFMLAIFNKANISICWSHSNQYQNRLVIM